MGGLFVCFLHPSLMVSDYWYLLINVMKIYSQGDTTTFYCNVLDVSP